LERDLDEPGLHRGKVRLDRFRTSHVSIKTSFHRIIDRLIFGEVIGAVPICINIIRQGDGNDKLPGITVIVISQTVASKCNRIDRCGFPQIDLDPAIGTVTHPTCPGTIQAIVDIGSSMDILKTWHGVLRDSWPSRTISCKC